MAVLQGEAPSFLARTRAHPARRSANTATRKTSACGGACSAATHAEGITMQRRKAGRGGGRGAALAHRAQTDTRARTHSHPRARAQRGEAGAKPLRARCLVSDPRHVATESLHVSSCCGPESGAFGIRVVAPSCLPRRAQRARLLDWACVVAFRLGVSGAFHVNANAQASCVIAIRQILYMCTPRAPGLARSASDSMESATTGGPLLRAERERFLSSCSRQNCEGVQRKAQSVPWGPR